MISYILSDQIAQPQKMVSSAGAISWDHIATVFGETSAQPVGVSTTLPLRFPGQEYDSVSGLQYNYFRDYDPTLGRFRPVGSHRSRRRTQRL